MIHRAIKIKIYPTDEQIVTLAQHFGCARWWWNYALNLSLTTYRETGKGLTQLALNAYLPKLKKATETTWLKDCYSQVLQATTLNLTTAYKNFFAGRARYPRFKSKKNRQSIQYPQNVKLIDGFVKFPGRLGLVRAKVHRSIKGTIKTVTVTMTPSGQYFASILTELPGEHPMPNTSGKVAGIDLGLKNFAIVNDGIKTSKYRNPRHLKKYERNLARKQKKLARKQKESHSRNRARKIVARVYERLSNARQDFLHKLSRKLANDNQVLVVENLNVKGMLKNYKLAKAISDASWRTFVNFLAYKLEREGKVLVEIDRWFPSSKLCSNCHYQIDKLPLEMCYWNCPSCGAYHDRDRNAAINIRAEGIRILSVSGTGTAADGGDVRPLRGRKPVLRQTPAKSEAHALP
ncbi:MAG: RNA-guided endonuclease TnpB family protein [Cyanobacteriota bacterium]|nr:RNA-guided endonuclease TnpB family protein [Cyanobacteriota bacterium]